MVSTDIVSVVRILLLLDDPVAVSFCTLRYVVDLTLSPSDMRLYACHISSDSSGTRVTDLLNVIVILHRNVDNHFIFTLHRLYPQVAKLTSFLIQNLTSFEELIRVVLFQ